MTIRVAIVAEGPSDWLTLEAIIESIHDDVEFAHIRPDMTPQSASPNGWRGVKNWCQEYGPDLETFRTGVVGQEYDLILIHVDCSMAHNEIERPACPPAVDTADALRYHVAREWLGLPELPDWVLLVAPAQSIDTWVVASLDDLLEEELPSLECRQEIENVLVAKRLLRTKKRKNGRRTIQKSAAAYRELVEMLMGALETVLDRCTEAARFYEEVQAKMEACRV